MRDLYQSLVALSDKRMCQNGVLGSSNDVGKPYTDGVDSNFIEL